MKIKGVEVRLNAEPIKSTVLISEKKPNSLRAMIPLCSYNEILLWQSGTVFILPLKGSVPSSRSVIMNNKLYIFGVKEGNSYNDTFLYDLSSYDYLKKSDGNIIHSSIVSSYPYVYVIGGATDLKKPIIATNSVSRYNVISGDWSSLSPLKSPRMNSGAILMNDKIYVIGGKSTETSKLSSIEIYDTEANRWTSLNINISPMAHITCLKSHTDILVISSVKEVYQINTLNCSIEYLGLLDYQIGDSIVNNTCTLVVGQSTFVFTGFMSLEVCFSDISISKMLAVYLKTFRGIKLL